MVEKMWNLKDLASASRMSVAYWRNRVHDGSLKVVRLGRRTIRVPDSEVRSFFEMRGLTAGDTKSCAQRQEGQMANETVGDRAEVRRPWSGMDSNEWKAFSKHMSRFRARRPAAPRAPMPQNEEVCDEE